MTTTFDWSVVAAGWDRHRDRAEEGVSAVTSVILGALDLGTGERVVELGSGTGELARRLAYEVGPTGAVLASDLAAGMVTLCEGTLAGLPQAAVAQVDAAATGLPAGAYDAVAFVMGLMFVVDQDAAAREIRRVLRPGGRAVITSWAGPEHNPWLAGLGMATAIQGLVAGGPPTEPGGLFSLADAARLERVLRAGGFGDVEVEQVPIVMRYPDADSWFETVSVLAGPLAAVLAAHPESIDAVRETATGLVSAYVTEAGLALPGLALVATARA